LSIDENGHVHTFREKPRFEEAYISGGFRVSDYKVFDYLKDDPTIMFERQPIADLGKSD
jgi:NDP-sugar pyrophosphorylase family protein